MRRLLIPVVVLGLFMVSVRTSYAYYGVSAVTPPSSASAGAWASVTPTPTPSPSPTPTPTPIVNPIVLNEIMYHPVVEGGTMPNGEWVELYNNSSSPVDVAGWQIKDALDHTITISTANSNNNGDLLDAGETVVPGNGWLVVYKNGVSIFNNAGDTVNLYNGSTLVDSVTYAGSKAAGLTLARIPDGTGAWVDPVATPGEPNRLEEVYQSVPVLMTLVPEETAVPTPLPSTTPEPTSAPMSTTPEPTAVQNNSSETPMPEPSATPVLETPIPSETPLPSPAEMPVVAGTPEPTAEPIVAPTSTPEISPVPSIEPNATPVL